MKTTVKVTLTVEIDLTTNWEASCSISQVYKQATDEAVGIIRHRLGGARIVGTPNVHAVTNIQEFGDVAKAGTK